MRFLLLLLLLPLVATASPPAVMVLSIDGAISPATADYVSRGLKRAQENGSRLVVLELDTPGGLDTSMREIVKEIIASPVPVATFVAPGGARAASAGTYILYASHVAAMAPGTNLGAATPVRIGIGGPAAEPGATGGRAPEGDGKGAQPPADTLERKQVHDAAAYIRSLAQLRGRNAEWAERAVREAVSLSADDALGLHVVDLVARDVDDLLAQAQGRRVDVRGAAVAIDAAGARTVRVDPDWRTRLLSALASPSLALVLMMVGIYGLLFEFSNPGYVLPGVVGAIALLLGLFAMQMLPVSYAGLGLILLGIAFLVAEVFVPSFGALGVGGIVAFVAGAVILVDTDAAGYGIPLALIVALALASAAFVLVVVRLGVKSRRARVVSGREELVGSAGEYLRDDAEEGWARVHGELWRVRSAEPLRPGDALRVTRVDGLVLDVVPTGADKERSSK